MNANLVVTEDFVGSAIVQNGTRHGTAADRHHTIHQPFLGAVILLDEPEAHPHGVADCLGNGFSGLYCKLHSHFVGLRVFNI